MRFLMAVGKSYSHSSTISSENVDTPTTGSHFIYWMLSRQDHHFIRHLLDANTLSNKIILLKHRAKILRFLPLPFIGYTNPIAA